MNEASPSLSIVVPVLDEAGSIAGFLQSLRTACDRVVEIIVVDGGSTDGTPDIAQPLCDRLVRSEKGRARQMNAGARLASGKLLWFVHADSHVPSHADSAIFDGLKRRARAWGHFDVRLSGRQPLLRLVERMMNWRSRLTGIATGDQGLFVSKELFESVGGFPDIALMEDIAMSRKLKSAAPPLCLRQSLTTSSRRWERDGIVRTIMLMWKLRLLYFFGADPARLARAYYAHDNS